MRIRVGVLALLMLCVLLLGARAEEEVQEAEEEKNGPKSSGVLRDTFAGVQELAKGTSLWASSGLEKVPQDVLEYACAKSFLSVKVAQSQSPRRRKQEVREKASHSCLKIMRTVEEKYALPGSHQASSGFCSELQSSVNSAQEEGHIFGSVSLADLFETAETYASDMNWRVFCASWAEQARPALQQRRPPKRRMLNMRRVSSTLHKKMPPPQEKPVARVDSSGRPGKEPDAVAKLRTAEIVDLLSTSAREKQAGGRLSENVAEGATPSFLQEVEAVRPFGQGSGHLEVRPTRSLA